MHRLQNRHQVLLDRHAREDARLLAQVAHPQPRTTVHRQAAHVLALEDDAAGVARNHSDGHLEAGRLAGPVLAQQANDLRLVDAEGDVVNDLAAAVVLDQPRYVQ